MQNGRKKGKFFVRCMFSIYYEKFTDYGALGNNWNFVFVDQFTIPDTVALLFY